MKITAMGSWQPGPGTLLAWQATTDCRRAAAQSPCSTRSVTFLAENHLRGSQASAVAGHPHKAYLGSGTVIESTLDVNAMTAALTEFTRRHSILRSWFDTDSTTGVLQHHLVDADAVAFEVHEVGALDDETQLQHHLAERFGSEAISSSFPGFAFGAIARPHSTAIFFGCDHALSDGASQALALTEIVSLYEATIAGAQTSSLPDSPPNSADGATTDTAGFLDFAELENAAADSHARGSDQFTAWRETFARHGAAMPQFPLDLGLAQGETAPVSPLELPILDGEALVAFDQVCKSAGGRVLPGVYAALAITGYELAGVDDYYGMTVFNSRAAMPQFATAQGWFCSFAPIEIPVGGADTFTELVPAAAAAYQRAKELAVVPVRSALAAMIAAGASAEDVVAAPNLLSYIDFRWFPGDGQQAYDNGHIFTGQGRTANASVWVNRDHDSLYLGSQTPDTPLAQYQVRRFFDRFRAIIEEVARVGEHRIAAPDRPEEINTSSATLEHTLARHHD